MLSENQVVAVRKAIESTYTGRCDIWEKKKVQKPNRSTGFENVMVLENCPCKLSFSSTKSTNATDTGAVVSQTGKVFLSPHIRVRTGSQLVIIQNGITATYENSGEPIMFSTHQEIGLLLREAWS